MWQCRSPTGNRVHCTRRRVLLAAVATPPAPPPRVPACLRAVNTGTFLILPTPAGIEVVCRWAGRAFNTLFEQVGASIAQPKVAAVRFPPLRHNCSGSGPMQGEVARRIVCRRLCRHRLLLPMIFRGQGAAWTQKATSLVHWSTRVVVPCALPMLCAATPPAPIAVPALARWAWRRHAAKLSWTATARRRAVRRARRCRLRVQQRGVLGSDCWAGLQRKKLVQQSACLPVRCMT